MDVKGTLNAAQLRLFRAHFRAKRWRWPMRVGTCVRLEDGRDLCRDAHGYYLAGMLRPGYQGLETWAKAPKRRRRR